MSTGSREDEWAEALRAGLAGDSVAYRRFLESVTPFLRAIAIRRCAQLGASRSDAEDVVQDVLLAIHLKRGTWDPARPIGPWVATIVRNKVIDAFRRRGRHIDVPIDDVIETLGAQETDHGPDRGTIERLVSRLKPAQRTIVMSISVEGISIKQTAERLKMTEGAVRVSLHRALKALAALYREDEF